MIPEHSDFAQFRRYQQLQRYVGWSDEDARRIREAWPLVEPSIFTLVDDFYATIQREPEALKVITGGEVQIGRLKVSLQRWLRELFSGQYDREYVERRWRVGCKHVEIGLDQVYTNMALSRLRRGLIQAVQQGWRDGATSLADTVHSLNRLLDLDLALIEDAYQSEYIKRQQQAQRLAAIGQVAGGIAHELRNPLNVVKTSVYYLLNAHHPTPGKIAEHLQRIDRQVGIADGVITALSEFAKLPLPDFRPVDLTACLRQALETSSVPDDIEVQIDGDATLPPALGDARQLAIVFANLIRNACDAMPHGHGLLRLSVVATSEGVRVTVQDNGCGIAPENLDRITEPLFSTKARGIGLGLAITRAILDKHGARLTVDSRPDGGSTFGVHLPSADAQAPGAER